VSMHARYIPCAPTGAECPYCAVVVFGVALPPSCTLATFTFRCPACRGRWTETRAPDGVERVWGPAPPAAAVQP
jgi:hypothetical protein